MENQDWKFLVIIFLMIFVEVTPSWSFRKKMRRLLGGKSNKRKKTFSWFDLFYV